MIASNMLAIQALRVSESFYEFLFVIIETGKLCRHLRRSRYWVLRKLNFLETLWGVFDIKNK